MRRLGGILGAAVGAVALAASPAFAAVHQVAVSDFAYTPSTVTVTEGDSVTWQNPGGTAPHDVNFDDGSFQQPVPFSGGQWNVTRAFPSAGTFRYHCTVHSSSMLGTVVVSQPAPGVPVGTATPVPAGGGVGAQGQPVATPCKSKRNFPIRVRQPRGVKIASAQVSVNGKPVQVSKLVAGGKLRHTARVDLRGLGKGTYTIDIVATTDKGKKLRGTRTYQTCAAKLTSNALPPL